MVTMLRFSLKVAAAAPAIPLVPLAVAVLGSNAVAVVAVAVPV
jgi:hypothetical protein